MKKRLVPTLIATAVIPASLLLMSNWDGPEAKSSGSPLENGKTCTQCHGGTANSGSGNLTISTDATYMTGMTHTISVSINEEMSSKFGFQAIAVDENDMAVGTFTAGTGQEVYSEDGADYIQHSTPSSTGQFTFDWKAPDSDVGDITIYVAGNASDGDNKTDGDLIYASTFTMTSDATGINTPKAEKVNVYPNPSNGQFAVDFGNLDIDNVDIFNLAGELVYSNSNVVSSIQLNNLDHGIYLLKAQSGANTLTKKVVVK